MKRTLGNWGRIGFGRLLPMGAAVMLAGAHETGTTMVDLDAAPAAGDIGIATFGGGCFWCLEAVFERVDGVKAVISGYAGGQTANPDYKAVCGGRTGHAEVVRVEYDPVRISYEQLLEVFWQVHDPTTLNRQGPDTGTQYRSIILYHNEAQKRAAEQSRQRAAARFSRPIVTQLIPLTRFYPAEDYHQDYYRKHPEVPYCAFVIRPKLEKFQHAQPGSGKN